MEKLIVEESEIIKEKDYQRIKKEINKKDNWFTAEEMFKFTKIYRKN